MGKLRRNPSLYVEGSCVSVRRKVPPICCPERKGKVKEVTNADKRSRGKREERQEADGPPERDE